MTDTATPKTLPELRFAGPRSEAAWAEFAAQGPISPGTAGWWQVWGAGTGHIQAGDLLLLRVGDGQQEAMLVDDLFTAKAAPMRIGLVVDGERCTIGALNRFALLRPGTHGTLRSGA